jgi:uncharacterized protein (TIRG00374 family)
MPDPRHIRDTRTESLSEDASAQASAGSASPRPTRSPHNRFSSHSSVRRTKQSKAATTDSEDDTKSAAKGALFLGAVLGVYVLWLVISGQVGQMMDALKNVESGWVIAACVCYGFYFVFGVGAYVVAAWLDRDSPVGIRDLMSVEASGVFFGNLTPMMAGSVPAQIVRLTRTGMEPGESMAMQFTRFIMYQFGVVLFAAIMLLARFEFFLETYGDIVFLNLVVFCMHALQLAALFVICLCPNFVMKVGNACIKWLSKRGWLKNYEHWYDVVNNQVAEFSDAFKRAASHLPSMLVTLVVTMCQLACLYMIPWFVLHAFGRDADFVSCLAAGSMVQMVSSAVPLPGGTGGAEGGFALFYGPLFGTSATAGYLVWRMITFFGPTILAFPMLGLQSHATESIYQRWNNFRHDAARHRGTYASRVGEASRTHRGTSGRRAGRGAWRPHER